MKSVQIRDFFSFYITTSSLLTAEVQCPCPGGPHTVIFPETGTPMISAHGRGLVIKCTIPVREGRIRPRWPLAGGADTGLVPAYQRGSNQGM